MKSYIIMKMITTGRSILELIKKIVMKKKIFLNG